MTDEERAKLIVAGELILHGYVGSHPQSSWLPGFATRNVIDALAEMDGDITVRLDSGGGSAFAGIGIYNALKSYSGNVTIHVDSIAASAASLIAMAADRLIIPETAFLMIHNTSTIVWGTSAELNKAASILDKLNTAYYIGYASRTGMDRDKIAALCEEETWMLGAEAVEAGFADEVSAADEDDADGDEMAAVEFPYADLYQRPPASLISASSSMPLMLAELLKLQDLPTAETTEANTKKEKGRQKQMPGKIIKSGAGDTVVDAGDAGQDTEAAKVAAAEATAAERSRAKLIREACTKAGVDAKFADDLIDEGVSIDDARAAVIDELAAKSEAEPTTDTAVRVQVGREDGEKFAQGVTDAVLAKISGAGGERNEFSSLTFMELGRRALAIANVKIPPMIDKLGLAGMMLNPTAASGQHSSSDFGQILSNIAEKTMLVGWDETPETHTAWTRMGTTTDFKTIKRVGLNLAPELDKVDEGAEFAHGTISDRGVDVQLATYGKLFAITRQAVINDDLNLFDRMPRMMGRAARRTIGNLSYNLLTANGNLGDGNALFSAAHKNVAKAANDGIGVPNTARLTAAKTAMMTQKDPDENATALNIRPQTLLVPAVLEDAANREVQSEFEPNTDGRTYNPHRGRYTVVSDARLDDDSETKWYMVGSPTMDDVAEITYLDGMEMPVLDRRMGWNIDGMEFKVRIDAAATMLDHRAIFRNG